VDNSSSFAISSSSSSSSNALVADASGIKLSTTTDLLEIGPAAGRALLMMKFIIGTSAVML